MGSPTTSGVVLAPGPSATDEADLALMVVEGMRVVDRAVRNLRALCADVTVVATRRPITGLPEGVAMVQVDPGPPQAVLAAGLAAAAHELVVVLDALHLTPDPDLLQHLAGHWAGELGVIPSTAAGAVVGHSVLTRTAADQLAQVEDLRDPAALRAMGISVLDELATASLVAHDRWSTTVTPPPTTIDLG